MKTIILFLAALQAQATTYLSYTPSAAAPPPGVSYKGATYASSTLTLDGTGGFYVQHNPAWTFESMTVELTVSFTDQSGSIMVKSSSASLSLTNQTFYTDWVTGKNDPYNLSSDRKNGTKTLVPSTKYVLKWCYDAAVGMVITYVNGIEDSRYYRVNEPGPINIGTGSFQILKGVKGKIYKVVITNDRPSPRTMRTVVLPTAIHYERIDPTWLGSVVRTTIENPYGTTISCTEFTLKSATVQSLTLPRDPGIYTVIIQSNKGYERKVCVPVGPTILMPVGKQKGLYNVRDEDFAQARATGANVLFSDWVMNREPEGSAAIDKYLSAAMLNGLSLSVVGNFQTARTNALNKRTGVHSYLNGDELSGNFERLRDNYNAIRVSSPIPVIGSLNNFTRIQEMAEVADLVAINAYNLKGDTRKITDLVSLVSKYRPCYLVFAAYENDIPTPDQLNAYVRAAYAAGAAGTVCFEWSHQEVHGGLGWYLPLRPELVEALKEVWGEY